MMLGKTVFARYDDLTMSRNESEGWTSEAYIGWKSCFKSI